MTLTIHGQPCAVVLKEATEDGLLPCPFCGGGAERIDVPDEDEDDGGTNAGGSCIQCAKCAASSALHFDRKENLLPSWNDRASEPSHTEAVRKLVEAHKCALDHIEHMAKWIASKKAGYSFEGLGEDMPGMRDALTPFKETP